MQYHQKIVSSYCRTLVFANCLKQKGVAPMSLAESLGPQNLGVTQAYLKELDTEMWNKALGGVAINHQDK